MATKLLGQTLKLSEPTCFTDRRVGYLLLWASGHRESKYSTTRCQDLRKSDGLRSGATREQKAGGRERSWGCPQLGLLPTTPSHATGRLRLFHAQATGARGHLPVTLSLWPYLRRAPVASHPWKSESASVPLSSFSPRGTARRLLKPGLFSHVVSLAIRFLKFSFPWQCVLSTGQLVNSQNTALCNLGTSWMDLWTAISGDVIRGQSSSDALYLALKDSEKSVFSYRNMLFCFYLLIYFEI